MKIDLAAFRESFIEEATEHIATMERGLLALETQPDDTETLNAVFRAAHSIKGAAGSLGFDAVAEFTHGLETMLDLMRQAKLSVTQERTTLLLQATDVVQRLLSSSEGDSTLVHDTAALRDRISTLCQEQPAGVLPVATSGDPVARRVTVTLVPKPVFFSTGIDPLLLIRDLATLGELENTTTDLTHIPQLSELDPERCYVAWTFSLKSTASDKQLNDVFLFVDDVCEVRFSEEQAVHAVRQEASQQIQAPAHGAAPRATGSTLKVPTRKVDALIDLVGEIVIAQSMIKQLAATVTSRQWSALQNAVAALEVNTLDLQERVMAIRMVPVDTVFDRFPRMVRDLAATMGKEVAFELNGQDTELDKGMVERLADPLTHLLRNALDHGLETPSERSAAGKPPRGTIHLSARHSAGCIIIELSDDGRGLDAQRIRAKAQAMGLVQPEDVLADDQIHALIFEPGFSTSASISDISGRGVGMDVVKRTVDALNGSVHVVTIAGQGTTFRIKLPLTLAIMDGLSLRVGQQRFIVPLLSVTESLSPTSADYKRVSGSGEAIILRDQILPLVRLSQIFQIPNAVRDATQGIVVVVETDVSPIGLLVDALLGQSQIVLKSLEANYKRVEGILGATILGDGQVALILDIPAICRLASKPRNLRNVGALVDAPRSMSLEEAVQ